MSALQLVQPTEARAKARVTLGAPCDVWPIVARLVRAEQETFVVLSVNVRNELLAAKVVALGTVCSVQVHPRDVFREAIKRNAAGIVVAHNHPSGDPSPSEDDWALTARLRACGDALGLPVLDHVIIGSKTRPVWNSMAGLPLW